MIGPKLGTSKTNRSHTRPQHILGFINYIHLVV